MDRFRYFESLMLGVILLMSIILSINGQAIDFPGPYCATRPGGCCKSRTDACSVPISSKRFFSFVSLGVIQIIQKLTNWTFHRSKSDSEQINIHQMGFHLIILSLFQNLIATLCYCDEFCGRFIDGDCCPDYESFCLGIDIPENITVKCKHNGQIFNQFEQIQDNCNTW